MIPNVKRGVSAVRARNSTFPTRWPAPGGATIGWASNMRRIVARGTGPRAAAGPGSRAGGGRRARDAAGGLRSGRRDLDDHQRVVVGVAQPKDRRDGVAHAADL